MNQALLKKTSFEKIKHYVVNFSSSNWKVCIIVLVMMAFIMFCRKPSAFLNPQFWAEDGAIFFQQYFMTGLKSFVTPYAGYLHTVQRIVALIASFFPVALTPAIYNFFALVSTLLPAIVLFSPRCFIPFKPLVALSIVLVPHSGEVFMTITSAQWFLCLLMLILLCMEPPTKFYQYILDYLIVIICGLSGPFIIFLFPLFFVRYLMKRTPHNLGLLLAVFICAMIQGMLIFYTFERGDQAFSSDINAWINLFGIKLFGRLFLGGNLYQKINPIILAVCFLLMPIVLIWLTSTKKQLYFTISFLFFGYAVIFSAICKSRELSDPFIYDMNVGDRFFFPYYIMIVWILLVSLTSPITLKRQISTVLLIMVLISTRHYFKAFKYEQMHWENYVEQIESGDSVRVPINPPGWFIELGLKGNESVNTNKTNENNPEME